MSASNNLKLAESNEFDQYKRYKGVLEMNAKRNEKPLNPTIEILRNSRKMTYLTMLENGVKLTVFNDAVCLDDVNTEQPVLKCFQCKTAIKDSEKVIQKVTIKDADYLTCFCSDCARDRTALKMAVERNFDYYDDLDLNITLSKIVDGHRIPIHLKDLRELEENQFCTVCGSKVTITEKPYFVRECSDCGFTSFWKSENFKLPKNVIFDYCKTHNFQTVFKFTVPVDTSYNDLMMSKILDWSEMFPKKENFDLDRTNSIQIEQSEEESGFEPDL